MRAPPVGALLALVLAAGCAAPDGVDPTAGEAPPSTDGQGAAFVDENRTVDSVLVVRHAATITCVEGLADGLPPAVPATYPSCDPDNPAPFDDDDRKPWVAPVDLSVERLAALGLQPTSGSAIFINLTWDENAGDAETFWLCTNRHDGFRKRCQEPRAEERQNRSLAHGHLVFTEHGFYDEPDQYEIWIEPTGAVNSDGNSVQLRAGSQMRDWTFTLEVILRPPTGSGAPANA